MTRHYVLVCVLLSVAAAVRADDSRRNAALDACGRPGDERQQGHCSFLRGLAAVESGKADDARQHLQDAARRLEAAGKPVAAWKALWVLVEYERRFGRRPDLKMAALEQAIALVERAKKPGAPFDFDSLEELREILNGSPHAPDSVKAQSLQLFEAVSRDGYAAALVAVGELEEAETQLGIASRLARPFGAMLDRSIARNTGLLRGQQGRLDEARESYRKALAAPKVRLPFTIDDRKEGDVAALHALAEIEMLGGRTDAALGWNDRALASARAAGERGAELSLLGQRATILAKGGRIAAAEQVYANALSAAKASGDAKSQVTLLIGRAWMSMERGRNGAAIADTEKAVELVAAIDDPLLESALLVQLAGMYLELGARDSANSALEKARAVAGRGGAGLAEALLDVVAAFHTGTPAELNEALERMSQRPEVREIQNVEELSALLRTVTGPDSAADRNAVNRNRHVLDMQYSELLGMLPLLQQERFPEARDVAMRILTLNPNAELRATLLTIISLAYAAEGQSERAADYAMRASGALDDALDTVLVDDLLSGFLGQKRGLFDSLIEFLTLMSHQEEAFAIAERARARAFLQLVGNRRIRPRSGADSAIAREAEALRMQIAQWQQQARTARPRELEDDLRAARRRYEALRTRVKATDPEYSAITSIEAAPLDEIRVELPPDTTLISYFSSRHTVHAWVLDRTTTEHVPLRVDNAWLESAICATKQLSTGGRGVRPRDTQCTPASAEELYGQLFAPLRAHVRNPRLIIVPHGALHYLPFAAFRDPRTARYLIEDYTITYAPSASSLRFLRDKETAVNGKALVLGAPAGVRPELPGAMREAVMVGTELRAAPMVGPAARESLLYRLEGNVDLVHIAAHGLYEPDTPLFSRLALAQGDGSDGNLEVHEILSDLDLTGVNLVVLSACQTALGKGNAGDEIVGLTRALLYAGTPGVISTLWDVGDDAAAALMDHFYCRFVGGDSAADALRYAQLQLLRGDYPDPRHWSAFTLHGDPEGRWNASGAITAAEK